MNRRLALVAVALAVPFIGLTARGQGQVKEISVVGNNFAFSPNRIEVSRDEVVKITFTAADMPHSFTTDEYRISKRAAAGQSVTFEFRADRPGKFTYYCNLSSDERCRNMKGELVVK